MLARERAAMDAEYWQSFVAQRYYYRSAQLPMTPGRERSYTWQHAYEQTHGHWLGALQVMRNLRDFMRRGMHRRALATLRDELSSDEEAEEAEEEEPESDADMEVEEAAPDAALAMQLRQEMETSALQPSAGAPSPAWFTGTVHRLG